MIIWSSLGLTKCHGRQTRHIWPNNRKIKLSRRNIPKQAGDDGHQCCFYKTQMHKRYDEECLSRNVTIESNIGGNEKTLRAEESSRKHLQSRGENLKYLMIWLKEGILENWYHLSDGFKTEASLCRNQNRDLDTEGQILLENTSPSV